MGSLKEALERSMQGHGNVGQQAFNDFLSGIKPSYSPQGYFDAGETLKNALSSSASFAAKPFEYLDEASNEIAGWGAEEMGRRNIPAPFAAAAMLPIALGADILGGIEGKAAKGTAKGLSKLASKEAPEWVARKAQAIEAMHGSNALKKIEAEYSQRGVPLFSHDLPMDEASRHNRRLGYNSALGDKALNDYGKTRTYSETGYILPFSRESGRSATMLDMSGRNEAMGYMKEGDKFIPKPEEVSRFGPAKADYLAGERTVDHRDLGYLVNGSESEGMNKFMSESGAIRVSPESGTMSIVKKVGRKPSILETDKAWAVMNKGRERGTPALIDIVNENGDTIKSLEARSKEELDRLLNKEFKDVQFKKRLPWAAFDPRMKDSRYLLASLAGGIGLREALQSLQQDKGIK